MITPGDVRAAEPRRRVYAVVPNGDGWIHKHSAFSLMRLLADTRYEVMVDAPTRAPYVNNLHCVVRDFLESGADYLLTFDDDNPPTRNPLDLVELDLDVVGCPTPVWVTGAPLGDRPYYWNALRRVHDDEDGLPGWKPLDAEGRVPEGLVECDAVGTGCVLIARRVLEAIPAPFSRIWDAQGLAQVGNDYAFCMRAKQAGFSIFSHFGYRCRHMKELDLWRVLEQVEAYAAGRESMRAVVPGLSNMGPGRNR